MHRYRVINVVPRQNLKQDFSVDSVDGAIILQDEANFYFIAPDAYPKEPVEPGVYTLFHRPQPGSGFVHEVWIKPTAFRETVLFNSQEAVGKVISRVKTFFERAHLASRANRGFLLVGPQGSGKSITISHVINHFKAEGGTVTIVYQTDQFRAYELKTFLQDLAFTDSVQRVILVMEDIGGRDLSPSREDPTFLSVLDNIEVTVRHPLVILATTNFPETLLENLLDRRGRFDDVVEFSFPDAATRVRYLQTYSRENEISDDFLAEIRKPEYDTLTVAHLEATIDDARLFQLSHFDALRDIVKHRKRAKTAFAKERSSIGLNR